MPQENLRQRLSHDFLGFAETAPSPTERQKQHVRWWALVVGVVFVVIGIWLSLSFNTGVPGLSIGIAGIFVMIALTIGIACLARFVLDIITSRNERGAANQHPQI